MIPRFTKENNQDPKIWDEFETFGFGFIEIPSEFTEEERQLVKDNFTILFGLSNLVSNFPNESLPQSRLKDFSSEEKPLSAIKLEMSPESILGFVDTPHTQGHLATIRSILMEVGDIMSGRWQKFLPPSFFDMKEIEENFNAMFFPEDRDHLDGLDPHCPEGLLTIIDVFNHNSLQYWDPLLLTWCDLVQPENHITIMIGKEFQEIIGRNKIMSPLIRVKSCPLNSLMLGYHVSQKKKVIFHDDDEDEWEFTILPKIAISSY